MWYSHNWNLRFLTMQMDSDNIINLYSITYVLKFPVWNETVIKNYTSNQPNTANVRPQVFAVVLLEIQVFWDILRLLDT
jgi:hypothetical protein